MHHLHHVFGLDGKQSELSVELNARQGLIKLIFVQELVADVIRSRSFSFPGDLDAQML